MTGLQKLMVNSDDETYYVGDTWFGVRHGKGRSVSPTGEIYEGYCYYDRKHGPGRLTWPDGSTYVGYFFSNKLEAYGIRTYDNGKIYQGLFRENQPYGIGVMSYVDGRQDVGLFQGDHLLQFMYPLPEAYNVPYLQEVLACLPSVAAQTWNVKVELLEQRIVSDDENQKLTKESILAKLLQMGKASDGMPEFRDLFESEFAKHIIYSEELPGTEAFTNNSSVLMDMERFARKMHPLSIMMDYDIARINMAERSNFFQKPGEREEEAVAFILAAAIGDIRRVQELYFQKGVNIDTCDGLGFTVLMAAALHGRADVAEFLLNFGADISRVTNQGYTAMELCFFAYHVFVEKYNYWRGSDLDLIFLFNTALDGSLILNREGSMSKPASVIPTRLSTPSPAINQSAKPKASNTGKTQPKRQGPEQEMRLDIDQKGSLKTDQTFKKVPIEVKNQQFVRAAVQLHHIRSSASEEDMDTKPEVEKPVFLVWLKEWQKRLKNVMMLLVRKGAHWRSCTWPQSIFYAAVRGLDSDLAELLLEQGSDVHEPVTRQFILITPILVACSMPGKPAADMVQLLLNYGANPNATEIDTRPPPTGKEKTKSQPFVGRSAIHVVCQRQPEDPATVHILNSLIKHGAHVDAVWNRLTPLVMAIQQGNTKMVEALLAAGSDENQDLMGGLGNALCMAATLATADAFLRTNKEVGVLQHLIDVLLQHNADFTVKIVLTASAGNNPAPLGSPLDYAKQVYAKQTLGANMNPQLKDILENFRSYILEAYKNATQKSVLRLRKISLAGAIYPEIIPLLQQQPHLIDGPDPLIEAHLSQNPEIHLLLKVLPGLRAKIDQISRAEDTVVDGKVLRPTLTVMRNPFRSESDTDSEKSSFIQLQTSTEISSDAESFITDDDLVIAHRSVLGIGGMHTPDGTERQTGKKGKLGKPVTDPDHVGLLVPAVHIIDENGDDIPLDHAVTEYEYCSRCGESSLPNRKLFPCPNCNKIFYCSHNCMEAHWPAHQLNCIAIAKRKQHIELYHKKIKAKRRRRRLTGDESETENVAPAEFDSDTCSLTGKVSVASASQPVAAVVPSGKKKHKIIQPAKDVEHTPKSEKFKKAKNVGRSKSKAGETLKGFGNYSNSFISDHTDRSGISKSASPQTRTAPGNAPEVLQSIAKAKQDKGRTVEKQKQSRNSNRSQSVSPYSDKQKTQSRTQKPRRQSKTQSQAPDRDKPAGKPKTEQQQPTFSKKTPEKGDTPTPNKKKGQRDPQANNETKNLLHGEKKDHTSDIGGKITNGGPRGIAADKTNQERREKKADKIVAGKAENKSVQQKQRGISPTKDTAQKSERKSKERSKASKPDEAQKSHSRQKSRTDNTRSQGKSYNQGEENKLNAKKPQENNKTKGKDKTTEKSRAKEAEEERTPNSRKRNKPSKSHEAEQKQRREERSLAARLRTDNSPKPGKGSRSRVKGMNITPAPVRKHSGEHKSRLSKEKKENHSSVGRDEKSETSKPAQGKLSRRNKRKQKKASVSQLSEVNEGPRSDRGKRSARKKKKKATQKYLPSDTDVPTPKKGRRLVPKGNKAFVLPTTMRKPLIKIKRLSRSQPARAQRETEWLKVIRAINQLRMDESMFQLFNVCYEQLMEKGINLASPYDIVELANGEYYTAIARQRKLSLTKVANLSIKKQSGNDTNSDKTTELLEIRSQVIIVMDQPETYFTFEKVNLANYSFG